METYKLSNEAKADLEREMVEIMNIIGRQARLRMQLPLLG